MTQGVLVVGGGIAGIQAALDLADSGIKVTIVETGPSLGGKMAQLDKTFPTNDCSMCIMAPKLVSAGRHPNVNLMTLSEVIKVEGKKGNYKVTIEEKPRYVDFDKCVGCGICATKCPKKVLDEYNVLLGDRKAVYVAFPQAVPLKYAIDPDNCIYLTKGKCRACEKACPSKAIAFDQKPSKKILEFSSIILSPGFEQMDPKIIEEYGWEDYPNVISGMEFERILSASGPYGGEIKRLSDGKHPKRIAFLNCVGSRDSSAGYPYCSSVCCMYSTKQAIIAKEHAPDMDTHVFFMDIRAQGKEFDYYIERAKSEYDIQYTRCRINQIHEDPITKNLVIRFIEPNRKTKSTEFDMVVLTLGLRPTEGMKKLGKIFGVDLNKWGFAKTNGFTPLETSKPGIYVCGAWSSPKDIPETVAQASGAAAKAMCSVSKSDKATVKKVIPPENETGDKPRIGVFVCHCGINIGSVVNVPEVVKYAKTLGYVVFADENLYSCSADTQVKIKELIKKHKLNRVVVASCTPRTHEPLFQETCQEAGLNPYLFEMANIREHCSWVHQKDKVSATKKAKDLVHMAVAKAKLLGPLYKANIEINHDALIIGGGLAGMTAGAELSSMGFTVHLIERTGELGGNLRHIKYLLGEKTDPAKELKRLVERMERDEKIIVHKNTNIKSIQGFVGNFTTTIETQGDENEIRHGVIIVATGGNEYKPTEYGYGKHPSIITQRELEEKIGDGSFKGKTTVMIQCVGCRQTKVEGKNYCSRICCANAIKNTLKMKEIDPKSNIFILNRDIRTYGFKEIQYMEARKKGLILANFEEDEPPEVQVEGDKIFVTFFDPVLGSKLRLQTDNLVLSSAIVPQPDNDVLAQHLKVPLSRDRFFLEAHMKLRPVDFATDGIFLCGLAHGPKTIDESISQAAGAAARAATVLSQDNLEAGGLVSEVDENLCIMCGTCEKHCPFGAVFLEEELGKATINPMLCKGCGLCAANCPNGAIETIHFTDSHILSQVKALVEGTGNVHGKGYRKEVG